MTWSDSLLASLKENHVRLIAYVPDKILVPLIEGVESDDFFLPVTATREEEAVGIVSGSFMGGTRGALMMQTSGFGNTINALASLVVSYQLPLLMIISERGILGEFNPCQVPITRTVRPTLDALGIYHATLERESEVGFLADRLIQQCFQTQSPAALILSPLLTGGKQDVAWDQHDTVGSAKQHAAASSQGRG